MDNKKIIAKGLVISILLLNTPTDAMADVIENYKSSAVDKYDDNSLKENKFEKFFNNLFDKFNQSKEVVKTNKNIRAGTVKEITLDDGDFVPNLDGNPDGYETIRVTTIGNKKLEKQDYVNLRESEIPKVDLSNSQSDSIPSSAFSSAKHLIEFKFPKGVTLIDTFAFSYCSNLTGDLIIPDTVVTINNQAFYECSGLNGNLVIPNSVTTIAVAAFKGCIGLTGDLVIPNSVTYIGNSVFEGCTGFNGNLILSNSLEAIEAYTFGGCSGLTGDLIIPDSVVAINGAAFTGCSGFNGSLVLSNNLNNINNNAFYGCSGFTGNLIIPNSVTSISTSAFSDLGNINKIVIKVNGDDVRNNYRYSVIDVFPDSKQTVIDLPYGFDTSGTWLEHTNKMIGKPTIKNIVDGNELDIVDGGIGKKISLHIPTIYEEKNITIMKDDTPYELPNINEDEKYIFTEDGTYNISIVTTVGNISNITFTIENIDYTAIEDAINNAEVSQNPSDIEEARDLVNSLPESIKKDEFQGILDNIFPNIEIEKKNTTNNFDIYVKSSNTLSLSLDTSSIMFEDFDGINNLEKLGAINFTVSSSLPYDINAYLANDVIGVNTNAIMDKRVLNIKKNGSNDDYKSFTNINTPLVLSNGETAGDNKNHSIDIMLKGGIPFEADTYKATVKLEIQQK